MADVEILEVALLKALEEISLNFSLESLARKLSRHSAIQAAIAEISHNCADQRETYMNYNRDMFGN